MMKTLSGMESTRTIREGLSGRSRYFIGHALRTIEEFVNSAAAFGFRPDYQNVDPSSTL